MPDTGCWILDSRYRILDTQKQILDKETQSRIN